MFISIISQRALGLKSVESNDKYAKITGLFLVMQGLSNVL